MKGERLEGQSISSEKLEREDERAIGDQVLAALDAMEEKIERAPTDWKAEVRYWSREYNDTEEQFARYNKQMPADKASHEDYRTTLAKYEEDIAYNWQRAEAATNKAMSEQLIRSPYELADTQGLGVVEPHETVEAATGIFYEERMAELNSRVTATDPTEETAAEQQLMRQTWRKVMDYVEASTDYDFLHMDYDAYQQTRRTCHNNMIRQLNALNLLAEKYGTTRFTPRNFMTNDFSYSARRDRGGRLNRRANYDRETVLAYFQTVFQKDFNLADKKAAKLSRGLQSGMTYYD